MLRTKTKVKLNLPAVLELIDSAQGVPVVGTLKQGKEDVSGLKEAVRRSVDELDHRVMDVIQDLRFELWLTRGCIVALALLIFAIPFFSGLATSLGAVGATGGGAGVFAAFGWWMTTVSKANRERIALATLVTKYRPAVDACEDAACLRRVARELRDELAAL